MNTYYWLAFNGISCTISPGPLPITLAVKPVPQLLVGCDSYYTARSRLRYFFKVARSNREGYVNELMKQTQRGEIVGIVPDNPDPPTLEPTRWDWRELAERGRRVHPTAYHEAGHAVGSFFLDLPFTSVDIRPDPDNHSLGRLRAKRVELIPYERDPATLYELERRTIEGFAGVVAESRYTGRLIWKGGSQDFSDNFQLALVRHFEGSFAEVRAFLGYCWVRTHEFVKHPAHWAAIVAVAEALNERMELSYEDVQTVISDAMREEEVRRSQVETSYPTFKDKNSLDNLFIQYSIRRKLRSLK